ncbi:MAG: hypothetical protein MO846_00400 [Candidatus Devosia symbiotica]|nr:hypothetical protein [Candidatus Devosia symbiotica]
MLQDSFAVREDETAYVGVMRNSTGLLTKVMQADISAATAPTDVVDKGETKRTQQYAPSRTFPRLCLIPTSSRSL